MDVAGAVGGDDHERRLGGSEGPELGHRDRVLREELEEERLELVVGAVHLVDEQNRRRPGRVVDGGEQRPADQESLAVDVVLAGRHSPRLGGPQMEKLAGVVPLVDRLRDVDALVALQSQQFPAGPRRQYLRHLGLARHRPHPRAAAVGAGPWPGRWTWPGPRRPGSPGRRGRRPPLLPTVRSGLERSPLQARRRPPPRGPFVPAPGPDGGGTQDWR